jgi:hypothetical protein
LPDSWARPGTASPTDNIGDSHATGPITVNLPLRHLDGGALTSAAEEPLQIVFKVATNFL